MNESHRWLLLVHQLPAEPSKLRVKIWRRLRNVGAVLVKNSVYVLPHNSETREDLEWIRGEIVTQGGEAVVFTADALDDLTTDEIVASFVAARRSDWEELKKRAEAIEVPEELEEREDEARSELDRELRALRNRAGQIDKIDYFSAPGRQEALAAIEARERSARGGAAEVEAPTQQRSTKDFQGRRWLTRPRPGVDRMASAWLIRRWIDPAAEFAFADRIPSDEEVVPFDMFGVEFGHHGQRCTFETLLVVFRLSEPPLERMARIVHDLDLRSESPADAETATVGRLVLGLREGTAADAELLEQGIGVFDALYRAFRRESSGA